MTIEWDTVTNEVTVTAPDSPVLWYHLLAAGFKKLVERYTGTIVRPDGPGSHIENVHTR